MSFVRIGQVSFGFLDLVSFGFLDFDSTLVFLRIGSVISFGLDISKVNQPGFTWKRENTRFYRKFTNR